jgi:hypothetical protein
VKEKEKVIDFKKKVVYDPSQGGGTESGVGVSDIGVSAAPIVTALTAEENSAIAEAQAENAAIANALSAGTETRRKKRHHKFTVVPLPMVPCVVFRGISGKIKQNMAVLQSFATLYKFISQNYGNRDVAFKMGVAEEVSEVATVCQSMPRVLDYYMWIVDALYRDGFGEVNADELEVRRKFCD